MYNIPNDSEAVRGRYCNSSNDLNPVTKRPFCSHAYSKYLFSDIIHFIGFLYGMYIFRWRENEELEMLMQKVTKKVNVPLLFIRICFLRLLFKLVAAIFTITCHRKNSAQPFSKTPTLAVLVFVPHTT